MSDALPDLVVSDVHTAYGDSYVLEGVSLQVEAGVMTVLMGRNGVGKTTLMRSIMGLTPPRRGTIRVRGEDVTGMPAFAIARRGVGLVPQGRRVFGSLTVREHLSVAGRKVDDPRWPIERILELFPPLRERYEQRAMTLSGGEQSMLAMARALRNEPQCLLLDEPTEGLAPRYVDVVLDVIRDLKAQPDLALLAVLPELPLALSVADRIYVMKKGVMAFEGTPEELESRPDIQQQLIGVG